MSCNVFSGNCLVRGCFAENRHLMFFWRQPGKGACDIMLEGLCERACDVRKGYKYNSMDSG